MLAAVSVQSHAAPYASGVSISGTTVNFILNEPADVLTYSINGGAAVALDPTTKGLKSFMIPTSSTPFSITASKNAASGFTIPTGGTIANAGTGLSQTSNAAGYNLISDDTSVLNRYNSPRGVSVSSDPNAPNFGTAYITNSAAGSVTANTTVTPNLPARTLTDEGLYALRADGADAFGFGDNGQNPVAPDSFPAFVTGSTGNNSPYRVTVAPNGDLYVADYSDVNGTIFKVDPALNNSVIVLAGIGGPGFGTGTPPSAPLYPDGTSIPPEQNHGSISSVWVEGSLAAGNLVVYAVDEDINSAHFGGAAQNDRNSLWRWDVGSGAPSTVTPTKIGGSLIGDFGPGGITVDMTRGADGKFYLSQNRSAGGQVGLQVISDTGTELFNSLTKSRELLANPTAPDILTNVVGIDVSDDQKWVAGLLLNKDRKSVV